MTPREILVCAPPGGRWHRDDYPWVRAVRACLRGGDGGAASDGTPGSAGETVWLLLCDDEIPSELTIVLGRGGRGAPGARDGQDAFAILELCDEIP